MPTTPPTRQISRLTTLLLLALSTLAAFLLLLTLGCASEDRVTGWGGTVDTLPNGAVRVTNSAGGLWQDSDRWRLVPELTLGETEGADWEIFSSIAALEVDDQGRIYVLDRHAAELRIFSPEGNHLRSVGREGSGPGEYIAANGLEWLSPDSLLVIDQQGNRYTVLTKEGEYARSVLRQRGFYAWAFEGNLIGGRIFEETTLGEGEDQHQLLLGTSLQDVEEAPSGAGDTIWIPASDAPPPEGFSVEYDGGRMGMSMPFAPTSVFYLDETGELLHGHGGDFRIFRSSPVGDTLLEIIINEEPAAVSPDELAEWAAGPWVQDFLGLGGKVDLGHVPKIKPYFEGLYQDPEGYLWVSVPSGPAEVVFAVIDPDGRYLGRLTIEGLERANYVDPVVRNGRLYLVGRDEWDVQRVYVFRIER